MKITKNFTPVTIVLEDEEELKALISLARDYTHRGARQLFSQQDKIFMFCLDIEKLK